MSLVLNLNLWPRQIEALNTPATELLFGGASRGGKSHFARVALVGWCLAIPKLQCTLIRKKFQDILDNHVYGPNGFMDILSDLIKAKKVAVTQESVTFYNGSRIVFKHCQDERQFSTAQGIASHVLFIDEATQISERLIRTFRAWCTMPEEMKASLPEHLKGKFPRIIYTANPIGVSVGFFRRHFVKAREAFSVEKVEGFLRQYIPSRVEDNPSEDSEAAKGRIQGMHDAGTAQALIEGDWDAPIGDFFPEWSEDRHVIPDFDPPSHWYRFRSFDWGTAEPFAVYWWAVADGESFTDSIGRLRWLPRGALVGYREWYGCDPEDPARGNRMRNEDIAAGILQRSPAGCEKGLVTLTDNLPFQDRGGKTIAETFAEAGVLLTQGDTSRPPGWSQLRSRLIGKFIDSNDGKRTPMFYVTESCKYLRDYLPAIPRHPTRTEDAAEHGEATHAPDAARLACMARVMPVDLPKPKPTLQDLATERITFGQAIERVQQRKEAINARW